MARKHFLAVWLAAFTWAVPATPVAQAADDVRYVEKDGVTMRETRQLVKRPVTETRIEPRERTVYRDQYSTDYQSMERSYVVPVTEYQWQPRYEYGWNLFAPPSLVYRQVAVTRWETRKETVRVPIMRRQVVAEKQIDQVPVTRQLNMEQEIVTRVEVAPGAGNLAAKSTDPFAGSATTGGDANRYGGISKLQNDPPSQGTAWKPVNSMMRR